MENAFKAEKVKFDKAEAAQFKKEKDARDAQAEADHAAVKTSNTANKKRFDALEV